VGTPLGQARRLRGYARLSRLLFPRSYPGKILLLAFVGTHVPLVALIGHLLLVADRPAASAIAVVLVALAATLAGTAGALLGLWLLLAPVAAASDALRAYRRVGTLPALPADLDGEAGHLLADVQQTLTELDAALGRLADQALRDPLTGLPNRRAFERRLAEDLADVAHRGGAVALGALDADGLKGVNDERGHAAGDACLRHLAATLTRRVGERGWAARWGGDEFVAVVREAAGEPAAETLLAEVEAELAAAPVALPGGGETALHVSWGVAQAGDGESAQALFARADAALYRAKRAGPGQR
jgi:diguanylate cyclase (GGDEF)-like protein